MKTGDRVVSVDGFAGTVIEVYSEHVLIVKFDDPRRNQYRGNGAEAIAEYYHHLKPSTRETDR